MNTWKRLLRKVKAPQLLVGLLLTLSFLTGCSSQPPIRTLTCSPVRVWAPPWAPPWGSPPALTTPGRARRWWLLGTAVGGVGGEMYGRSVNPPPYYQTPSQRLSLTMARLRPPMPRSRSLRGIIAMRRRPQTIIDWRLSGRATWFISGIV